jgi:hypothetical protein
MAALIQRKLFEEIRDQLGWYPVWPVGASIEIGRVGLFHSRHKEFEWISSLKEMNINIEPVVQGAFDEMYATQAAVSCNFRAGASKLFADFSFCRRNSIAAQGYNMKYLTLPIGQLEKIILQKIANKEIEWNYQWVILSEAFSASGFSMIMSGGNDSYVSLSANSNDKSGSFNIADVELGIEASSYKNIAFQSICKKGASPYFYIHKLVYNNGKPYLRRYANRSPLAYMNN